VRVLLEKEDVSPDMADEFGPQQSIPLSPSLEWSVLGPGKKTDY